METFLQIWWQSEIEGSILWKLMTYRYTGMILKVINFSLNWYLLDSNYGTDAIKICINENEIKPWKFGVSAHFQWYL